MNYPARWPLAALLVTLLSAWIVGPAPAEARAPAAPGPGDESALQDEDDNDEDTKDEKEDEGEPEDANDDDPKLPENDVDDRRDEESKATPEPDSAPLDTSTPGDILPDSLEEQAEEDLLEPYRVEPSIFPLVAYSSDRGFGFGFIGGLTKHHPNYVPHRWNLRARALIYIGPKPSGGGVRVPYQSYKINFTAPHAKGERVGFAAVLGFRRVASANYYGIGNATTAVLPTAGLEDGSAAFLKAERYYDYGHTRIWGAGRVRVTITPQVHVYGGGRLNWEWVSFVDDSKLVEDLANEGDQDVRRFLVLNDTYGALEGETGIVYSSLDRPTSPSRGMLHELSLRGGPTFNAPGVGYGGVNLQTQFYLPMLEDRLVAAYRIVLDGLFGEPTLPELARFGGRNPEFAPGGSSGVRGVPRQRYHGKIKALSNLEIRSVLLRTKLARRAFDLGLVAFFDAGRVWSDWKPTPELDGTALGLKVGLGGGVRLQWGPNFVLRTDVAWSPDGIGVYLDAGHAF